MGFCPASTGLRALKSIAFFSLLLTPLPSLASDSELAIPDLHEGRFILAGQSVSAWNLLLFGGVLAVATLAASFWLYRQIVVLRAHRSMLDVAETIYQTCRTYLIQQGKFLVMLFALTGLAMSYYFIGLEGKSIGTTALVLFFAIVGICGSYTVAWFGIRVNNYANARTAFASLKGKPWEVVNIPLRAGMSIGLFLISLELILMLIILLFVPRQIVGYCFLGFAIGESLGASALRIAGGIFTKIADIGSDLMKIAFNVKEDDPRNPGVIADCTGDNAGDSVGPTADGFETYGVTGVALISFITLAVPSIDVQIKLIVWIFAMRLVMGFASAIAYFVNQVISAKQFAGPKLFNFEIPLTRLIWISAVLCIGCSYLVSWLLLPDLASNASATFPLWAKLATIISFGTLAAVLIPEFTKVFTSSHSGHVQEIVTASREGGASLTILSGIVAGDFSAFWTGMLIAGLMACGYYVSQQGLDVLMSGHGSTFAFGLIAFGFLCMGPVTIAVDSYGPVTDNAQSVYELSQIEQIGGITEEIQRDFGFTPDWAHAKHSLEANDVAGNTFKATAKPVLIGTAVVGATTMIFSIILLLEKAGMKHLDLTAAPVLLGFICGGSIIFWFSGASTQAVSTGAYRAVAYIKQHMNLNKAAADIEDSKTVVRICTEYAQAGMWNIFIALMTATLAFAFFDPNFFVAYLISIAVFGLFQAIYMANAGGAWDNAKKVVEVDLGEKGTPLHAATVIGDTVGDPFKDTTSVALNPIIKFSTLFGLLAVEIAVRIKQAANDGTHTHTDYTAVVGGILFVVALIFIYRSFYGMRIPRQVHTDVGIPATTVMAK